METCSTSSALGHDLAEREGSLYRKRNRDFCAGLNHCASMPCDQLQNPKALFLTWASSVLCPSVDVSVFAFATYTKRETENC